MCGYIQGRLRLEPNPGPYTLDDLFHLMETDYQSWPLKYDAGTQTTQTKIEQCKSHLKYPTIKPLV